MARPTMTKIYSHGSASPWHKSPTPQRPQELMPILDLICSCGNRYEAIQSFSTHDPSVNECPMCGAKPKRVPTAGTYIKEKHPEDFNQEELREHLEAKAYYESPEVAQKILSGEIKLKEKGPRWLRPVCPDELRKKIF